MELVAKAETILKDGHKTSWYIIFEKKQYKLCSAPLCIAFDKSRFGDLDTLEKHYIKISNKFGSKFVMQKRNNKNDL